MSVSEVQQGHEVNEVLYGGKSNAGVKTAEANAKDCSGSQFSKYLDLGG